MTKKATFVKEVNKREATGDQRLYRLDPPIVDEPWDEDEESTSHEFVVSSATVVCGEPETYIFPSDKNGKITSWSELDGSYKGGLSHDRALAGAGYEVA